MVHGIFLEQPRCRVASGLDFGRPLIIGGDGIYEIRGEWRVETTPAFDPEACLRPDLYLRSL